jgi:hypothetical protein
MEDFLLCCALDLQCAVTTAPIAHARVHLCTISAKRMCVQGSAPTMDLSQDQQMRNMVQQMGLHLSRHMSQNFNETGAPGLTIFPQQPPSWNGVSLMGPSGNSAGAHRLDMLRRASVFPEAPAAASRQQHALQDVAPNPASLMQPSELVPTAAAPAGGGTATEDHVRTPSKVANGPAAATDADGEGASTPPKALPTVLALAARVLAARKAVFDDRSEKARGRIPKWRGYNRAQSHLRSIISSQDLLAMSARSYICPTGCDEETSGREVPTEATSKEYKILFWCTEEAYEGGCHST